MIVTKSFLQDKILLLLLFVDNIYVKWLKFPLDNRLNGLSMFL